MHPEIRIFRCNLTATISPERIFDYFKDWVKAKDFIYDPIRHNGIERKSAWAKVAQKKKEIAESHPPPTLLVDSTTIGSDGETVAGRAGSRNISNKRGADNNNTGTESKSGKIAL